MKNNLKIALACPGIGQVSRGYEASVLEIYEATKGGSHQVRLFRGGRSEQRGEYCPTVTRCNRVYDVPPFSRAGFYRRYWLDNFIFCLFLYFRILFRPVDVIFTPDHIVADLLHRYRKLIPGQPAIIFSNGAPFENEFCKRFQYVHQKSKEHFHEEDAPDTKMFLIGNGFETSTFEEPADFDRLAARKKYQLPKDKIIILCLSALNPEHKRIDWIINEVARLDDRFHLALCGQEGPGTPTLRVHAKKANLNCTFMKVPLKEVPHLLWCSDLMVLGSLSEGFPRVIAEAMASKTPILVHPHENARWILGEKSQCFADMTVSGDLAAKINHWAEGSEPGVDTIEANHQKVNLEYSRETVLPQYLAMFEWVGRDCGKLADSV